MRRSDFDVTGSIRTTDPIEVCDEVVRLFRGIYRPGDVQPMVRAFGHLSKMYYGKHNDYHPCDTEYHDIQHVLDVTLAMARLMDGYQRENKRIAPLPAQYFTVGIITALFHDVGYLRRRGDHKHRYGAEYTLTHVGRGSRFLRRYLPRLGLRQYAEAASMLIHFTGYERDATTIRMSDPVMRRVGEMLGSADIIAQMSDRCYLEKCHDRLYPELVLGGIARRKQPDGSEIMIYRSGRDLVSKTPAFYAKVLRRLDEKLNHAYRYAENHFGGMNLYMQEMQKNARYAEFAARGHGLTRLRRTAPSTLARGVKAYPESLVIR